MSADYLTDSPVRGMVRMADYLRVVRENERLREELTALREINKPVLLAHEVVTPIKRRRYGVEPRAAGKEGIVLAALRQAATPLTTHQVREAAGMSNRSVNYVAVLLCNLRAGGWAENINDKRGKGVTGLWRATRPNSQPME